MAGESGLISSDMAGTEEFADMTEEQLAAELPVQGDAPAGGTEGEPADRGTQQNAGGTKAQAQGNGGGAAGTSLEPQKTDTLATIMDKIGLLETALQNMNRENRAYQALQSRLDRLENAAKQKASQPQPALSPEAQSQQEQQEAADKFIRERAQEEALKAVEARYGNLIQPLQMQQLQNNVLQQIQAAELPVEEMKEVFTKLLNEDAKLATQGDAAAIARIQKLVNGHDSSELMLRGVLEHAKMLRAKGATVAQTQAQAAGKGGRMVSATGQRPQQQGGKKTLENMTPEEIEGMDMEELGKLIPKQRR